MHEQPGQTNQPARPATPRTPGSAVEPLEPRALFATAPLELAVGPNVNISRTFSNQNEGTVAIDPTDPARLFAAAVMDDFETGELDPDVNENTTFTAYSDDAGATWNAQLIGVGPNVDGFATACCDPTAAWDEFGNLFYAYLGTDPVSSERAIEVLLSTDGGRTFRNIYRFVGRADQPTIVTGEGMVWVNFETGNQQVANGARVLGFNAVEEFMDEVQVTPRSLNGRFGDIAIGPNGEVMVSYQAPSGPGGKVATIYASIDPDGLGPRQFERRYEVSPTNIAAFDFIPPQDDRSIDAQVSLAWDRSGGPFNGRVYAVYTDEPRNESSSDLNIYLRFSDDNGATWSTPRQANDQDFGERTQFLSRTAIDQTTGNLALVWHDTRNPQGVSFGDNLEAQLWGTAATPTIGEQGVVFATNVQISAGTSDAHRSRARLEYGDYLGLDFRNNVFHPVWADNSNSTGDNPSGGVTGGATDLATLDLYTARVTVTSVSGAPTTEQPIGPGSPLSPDFVGKDTVTKGKSFRFKVQYESVNGVDATTLGDDDLMITGPNGFNLFADFVNAKRSRRNTVVTGTYQLAAPGGKFDVGDNGLYTILLQAGAVRDLGGVTTNGGLLNQFLVSATAPAQSPALLPAAAAPRAAALAPATTRLDDAGGENDDEFAALGLA